MRRRILKEIDAAVCQTTSVPFTKLVANLGYKSPAEVKQMEKKAETKVFMQLNKNVLLRLAAN